MKFSYKSLILILTFSSFIRSEVPRDFYTDSFKQISGWASQGKDAVVSALKSCKDTLSSIDCKAYLPNTQAISKKANEVSSELAKSFKSINWQEIGQRSLLVAGPALILYAFYKKVSFNPERLKSQLLEPYHSTATAYRLNTGEILYKDIYPKREYDNATLEVHYQTKINSLKSLMFGLTGTALTTLGLYNK